MDCGCCTISHSKEVHGLRLLKFWNCTLKYEVPHNNQGKIDSTQECSLQPNLHKPHTTNMPKGWYTNMPKGSKGTMTHSFHKVSSKAHGNSISCVG